MSKIILLDIDGVVLRWDNIFSKSYAEEYNIPYEKLLAFFKGEFPECSLGLKDLKQVLPKYLEEWGWKKSVDDFLDYWFKSQLNIDEELMAEVKRLRGLGTKVYLASNQERYRTEYLKNELGFEKNFDGAFISCEIGAGKDTPNFFNHILETLKTTPEECLFFDDDIRNIQVAQSLGIKAVHYQTIEDFKNTVM